MFFILTDIGPKIQYFLLCDSLPEDRNLREDLQHQRLVGLGVSYLLLNLYSLTQEYMFSILLSMHFLRCIRRICLTINSSFNWQSFPVFLLPLNLIQGWHCRKKFWCLSLIGGYRVKSQFGLSCPVCMHGFTLLN